MFRESKTWLAFRSSYCDEITRKYSASRMWNSAYGLVFNAYGIVLKTQTVSRTSDTYAQEQNHTLRAHRFFHWICMASHNACHMNTNDNHVRHMSNHACFVNVYLEYSMNKYYFLKKHICFAPNDFRCPRLYSWLKSNLMCFKINSPCL